MPSEKNFFFCIDEAINENIFWKKHSIYFKPLKYKIMVPFFLLKTILLELRVIIKFLFSRKKFFSSNEVFFLAFSFSHNNEKALYFLKKRDDFIFYPNVDIFRRELAFKSLKNLFFLNKIIKKREDYLSILPFIRQINHFYVSQHIWYRELIRSTPKSIIVANDMNGLSRALVLIAKKMKIKTVYTQHGSVSSYVFPRLIADFSFLDGWVSYDCYKHQGKPDGMVVITGRMNLGLNDPIQALNLGIATNKLDSLSTWARVIFKLKKTQNIIIRPHPADPRKIIWWFISKILGVEYSNGNLSFFLEKCKILIVGTSGITLDAAIKGVTCFFLGDKNTYEYDYYQYKKYKMLKYFNLKKFEENICKSNGLKDENRGRSLFYEAGILENPHLNKNKVLNFIKEENEEKQKKYLEKYFVSVKSENNVFTFRKYEKFIEENVKI